MSQQPITDGDHRVLKFRPRTLLRPPSNPRVGIESPPLAPDLTSYESTEDEPDDYRHRMLTNVAAALFTAALTAAGIWLAMSIADLRKTQDCVLAGHRDCANISVPR